MNAVGLPETWAWAKLSEVAEIVGGATPLRANSSYYGGTIPWVTPTDLSALDSMWIDDSAEHLTSRGVRSSGLRILPTGAVLMSSRATIGITAITRQPICINQDTSAFLCRQQVVYNGYLAWCLRIMQPQLDRIADQTTLKGIRKSVLSQLQIPLPTLPEQERIATILGKAYELRRLCNNADSISDDIPYALFDTVFGDLLQYPYKTLIDLCEPITKGSTPPADDISTIPADNSIPFLRVQHIGDKGDLVFHSAPSYINIETHMGALRRSHVYPGDVIINIVGPPLGKIALVPNLYPEYNVNQALAVLRPRRIESLYLFYVLRSSQVLPHLIKLAQGGRQLNLSLEQCRSFKIPVPPRIKQLEFVKQVRDYQKLKLAIRQKACGVDELFQTCVNAALNGGLTAVWRERNIDSLRDAATALDVLVHPKDDSLLVAKLEEGDISEAERRRLQQAISEAAKPAILQLANELSNQREVIRQLGNGPLLDLSKTVQPAFTQYRNLVNSELFRSVQQVSEVVRKTLAINLQPIIEVQQHFAQLSKTWSETTRQLRMLSLNMAQQVARTAALVSRIPDDTDPRYYTLRSLSYQQYRIYIAVLASDEYVTPENISDATGLDVVASRQGLQLLASVGLLQVVSLPLDLAGGPSYVSVYRALQDRDTEVTDFTVLGGEEE